LEIKFRDRGEIEEKTQDRGSLFYNQYQWSVTWHQPEITALRDGFDPARISKIIASRRNWSAARRRYQNTENEIPVSVELAVKDVAQYLSAATAQYKMVLSPSTITLYSNDREFVDAMAAMAAETKTQGRVTVKTASLTNPPDTVVLKTPYDYSYRTWFRGRLITAAQRETLHNWIVSMGPEVYACPSMSRWLRGGRRAWATLRDDYCQRHFFVDHNDAKLDVWMAMVCPGIVRKTQTIQSPAK